MRKTRREIAREVDAILAAGRGGSAVGEAAYRRIQEEAQAAEFQVRMADLKGAIAAQRSPLSAHQLVAQSEAHAEQADRLIEYAQASVREAHGTPQLAAVERVLASIRNAAARAKAQAAATKRAFEKRFGKHNPNGLTDQNMQRAGLQHSKHT